LTRPQPGLPLSIPLKIPSTWTPQEALVVFELLDDLREKICDIYGPTIQDEMRRQRQTETG